jgi:hypothetical protein
MEVIWRGVVEPLSATWSNMHVFTNLMLQEFNTYQPKILFTQQAFADYLEACTTKAPSLILQGPPPPPAVLYVAGVNMPFWNSQGAFDLPAIRHAIMRVRMGPYYHVLNTEFEQNLLPVPPGVMTMALQPPTPAALALIMHHLNPLAPAIPMPNVFDALNPDLNNEALYEWNNGNFAHLNANNVMNSRLFRYAARQALCDARNINAVAYRPAVVKLLTHLVAQLNPRPPALQSIILIRTLVPSLLPPFPVVPPGLPLLPALVPVLTAAIDFHRHRLIDIDWGPLANRLNYQRRIRLGRIIGLNENVLGFRRFINSI